MSEHRLTRELPEALLGTLSQGVPALLLTVGEDRFPGTAYTWLVAVTPTRLHFGVDHGTATLTNLERTGRCALQVINAGNQIYLIKGSASLVKERLDAAPFKMGMWALTVEAVKDQSWPGVVVHPLGYEWAPDQREAMLEMERAVYREMLG